MVLVMAASRYRIRAGSVRRKRPADVLRLVPKDGGQTSAALLKNLREAVDHYSALYADDAAGYAFVIWDRSGRIDHARDTCCGSPFGRRTIPAIVHDILAEDHTEQVVIDVFNRR